jgi:transposase
LEFPVRLSTRPSGTLLARAWRALFPDDVDRKGHKLTGEVLAFVKQIRAEEPDMTTPELVRRIQKKFSLQVHRKTVERALSSAKSHSY